MSDIINKVQMYLNQVSKEPVEISDKLVEEFGEACKNALRKQFSEERRKEFKPRMSNIGRPLCQLQMEAKNVQGEGQPYNVKMRNTFGDLIEALAVFVLKSAGVDIEDEQKNVKYKFNGSSIEGRLDVKIDKKVWDIKSASPYSFEKKFGTAGGFEEVVKDDAFGYVSQGYLYSESEKLPFGGWIVPSIYELSLLILIGLFGSIANLLLTQSYKLAEVSLTTPLKYLSLVLAIIFGFYFFNEIPTVYTLIGASLIVVSSAIIFIREHQLKKPITLPRQQ